MRGEQIKLRIARKTRDACAPVEVKRDGVRTDVRVEHVLELIVRDRARLVSATTNTPTTAPPPEEGADHWLA